MAGLETLAHGYGLIEGPCVDADGNLYFSDVPNGGVHRRSPDGEITLAVPKRRGVGGIVLHADGGLVVGGRNLCHVVDGDTRVLFDPGVPLNDLTCDPQGRVVCGTLRMDPFNPGSAPEAGEAYRVGPDGGIDELYRGVRLTNGIAFSPDGTRAYHADTFANHVICHDVDGDTYRNRRPLFERPGFQPDGLAVDVDGVVWVADYEAGCVRGLDPERNTEVGRVEVPSTAVTSVCFGGTGNLDLYITTADNTERPERGGTIFRTRAEVPGVPVAAAVI